MKAFIAIFAILAAVAGSQAIDKSLGQRIECFREAQTRIYESSIKELVEGLRDQLKVGIPDKNIPPMDPFVMDNWNLKINEDFAKLDWTMDGKIDGLMNWSLDTVKFSIAGFKFSFGINLPSIEGKGNYNIDGTIVEVLPLYGSGEFDVVAQNLNITGSGKLGSRGTGDNQTLFLENFQIGISLGNFQFAVTGLMDDANLSFLLSKMVSDSLPDLINNFQGQINKVISTKITTLADQVLGKMTIADILDMLKPKPKPDPEEYMRTIGIHCGDY